MKYCPTCRSQYTDDSLRFCLQDGSLLVERLGSDTPTVAFNETPTVAASRAKSKVAAWRDEDRKNISGAQPKERRTGIAVPIAATAAIMLLLFSVVAVGIWIYATRVRTDAPENKDGNASNTNAALQGNAASYLPTPSPTASASPKATVSPTLASPPPPNTDLEAARREVTQTISGWKSMAEAKNLNAYMANYSDTVDYYNRRGARRMAVMSDKARAFRIYDSIRIALSNMNVSVDESGSTATAVFDKEWDFSGSRSSSGKVRTQLKLRSENGRWLITGERDLKVYYTR
ncbi:MAG: hypothetical protein ACRD6X_03645 [Pyrinomonadaceae bacterium]